MWRKKLNPFSVKTPETLTPENIASLFIDVFSDFPRLLTPEHTFLHGARGTGKSMMLRYMEPQVQLAAKVVSVPSKLEYFAVHMPIKSANYALSELERLEGAPYFLLAEHFLVTNATIRILTSLVSLYELTGDKFKKDIEEFYSETAKLLDNSGTNIIDEDIDLLDRLINLFVKERGNAKTYMVKLAFNRGSIPYNNVLFNYEEFFLPFIRLVKGLSNTPKGPIYLMLDDADNLPVRMQSIVNGWVSYRTTNDLCLKISTQQKYKTWRTTQGILIESAHDFSEIDISAVYTSKNFSHYYDRVEKIIEKRLELNGFAGVKAIEFFPTDEKQISGLEQAKQEISLNWDNGKGVSKRKGDDITRYSTSVYMRQLGVSKKKNRYSYSGFRSLVDISSGMIRYFLEPASRMYAELESVNKNITCIPPTTQDLIIYRWSEEYVLEELNRLKTDEVNKDSGNISRVAKLKILVNSIGQIFQNRLVSSDTERRFISFMLTDFPNKEDQEILDLAVEWGYFTAKTIGRKEGVGRNILYVLNRRLAPHFKLDPSGYAAHMSIKPEHLKLALKSSSEFVRERTKSLSVMSTHHQSELDI